MSALEESPNTKFRQFYTASRCSNLPLELINSIFRQCNRDDLKQCALTCRSWNAAAHPVLFSKIVLNSRKKVDKIISLLIKDNAIGPFVKEVDVLDMELDLCSLYLFSKIFTNIESITFDNRYYRMYKSLYVLLSAGELSSLKIIPIPAIRGQNEIYLKCVDVIKCRITVLDIIGVKVYKSLQQSFHTFIKLKTINIQFYDSLFLNTLNLLEDITQKSNLPSLKRIDVTMVWGNSVHNRLFSRIDDIQPMPNVSDLNIRGYVPYTIIDDTSMRYIIKKFPNLQRLQLLSNENDYDDCNYCYLPREGNQIVLSVDVTMEFLEYISRMSTFNVQHIATEEKTVEIIKKFCSNRHKKKSLGNSPSLYICYNEKIDKHGARDLIFPVVSIKSAQASQKHAPSVSVGLNPFYDPIFNNGQEEQKIIKHTGQYFTKITLDNVPTFSLWVLLTNTAKYCVNLKELVILDSSDLLEETAEWCDDLVVNHSLTHLTIEPNVECPNVLSLLSCLFTGLEMLSFSSTITCVKLPKERFDLNVPRLSVKHFQIELPAYKDFRSKPCSNFKFFVQLDVEEKSRYLLFSVVHTELKTYYDHCPIKFDKEITASEFEESKKNDQNYYIYRMQCKSTDKVSIKYPAENTIDFVYRIHEVHF